ncbi:MAG: mechanosensitive ion channel family protein [Desulfovibrio sp.]|nr:mechanosensitive ion channel family protein [Desulfovibrio sp.]
MNKVDTIKFFFEYFDLKYFLENNSPLKLLILAAIVCALMLFAYIACKLLKRNIIKFVQKDARAEKQGSGKDTRNPAVPRMDKTRFSKLMHSALILVYLLIWGWGLRQLVIGPIYNTAVDSIFTTLCTLAAIRFVSILVPFYMDTSMRKHGTDLENSQSRSLMPIVEGLIWAIGGTFLLDNLGLRVSTIIAGLGIVGVAVGMAGQTIIKDFFGYIVILLDRPFRIGDFVILSTGKSGSVTDIGPKNTRLLSLEGDIIICPNAEITSTVITNQGDIREREVEIVLGIAYSNPMPIVRKFPDMIREVVNSFPQCRYERCCMTSFGTANYLFQLIYKVKDEDGDLDAFMNTQMEVNLAIQEKENQEKITGAYPTQTILLTDMTPPKPAQD